MEVLRKKTRVYCETSFWNYLTALPSADPERAMRQAYTLRWWNEIAPKCEIFVSGYVYDEAQDGDTEASAKRIAEIVRQNFAVYDEVKVANLTRKLHEQHQVFATEVTDAIHIAVATVTQMDILLTWNCKHMANIVELPKTVRIISQCGYECPLIVTPKDFLEEIHV